jgi:hypothetical protein
MLASITPLGERARGSRFWLTAAFFVGASIVAAAGLGALLGGLGSAALHAVGGDVRLALLAAALLAGFALDVLGRLPGPRRQVNEDWLREYRGWVYGAGFGGQLGVSVATIVTTSLVYATLCAAFLSASAGSGALVAGVGGAARGLTLLAGARVQAPDDLVRLHGRIGALRPRVRFLARVAPGVLAVFALAAVMA